MPVINGVYLKDFAALPGAVDDANIIPIAISGNQVAYRTTVSGIITDARITGKLLTGLSVTGTAILATDTILSAFGKVQNQLNNRVSSVGLTMPSAFSVANSPVTTSGTLAVTAAGLASQYIRGDGTLADFPTEGGGGGSSVSYYLNGSINQGTFVGNTYYEMNKTPVLGAGTDFTIASNGYIAQFITDTNDPNSLIIPAGNFNLEFYFSASSSGGTPSYYVELYKYDGASFTLIASNSVVPELIAFGTTIISYFSSLAVPETVLTATDRLAIRIYVNNSGKTITLHTEDNHLCQIITTFTTGLQSLNGLSKQAQFFATGSAGTDFAIVSSTDTHTFNIPSASASNRGLITTGTQTFAGAKTFTDIITSSKSANSAYTGLVVSNPNTGMESEALMSLNSDVASLNFRILSNNWDGGFNGNYTSITASHKLFIGSGDELNISSADGITLTGVVKFTSTLSNGTYTYTLPSATGTLALTSQLTGGTVTSVGATAGTGISVSGSPITSSGSLTITNTAPDQTVVLTAGTGISTSGTYPNFTITNTSPSSGGTVTSVAALTLGTSGTDLSSSVANGTTTPVITLNVPTASAANRGALSSTDWSTFNGKQAALSGTGIVKSTGGVISYLTDPLPIANGGTGSATQTFVDLSSTQTISGLKTFSLSILLSSGAALQLQSATTSNYAQLQAPAGLASNIVLTMPSTTGTLALASAIPANPVGGTGTTNYLSKFTGTSTIGNSSFYDNGTLTAVGNRISTNSFVGLVRNFNILGTDAVMRVARYTDDYATLSPSIELLNYSDDGVYRRFYWDSFINGDDNFAIRQRLTGGGMTTNGTVVDLTRLILYSGGNVGIGTSLSTNAGYKLDVNGTGRFSDALTGTSATFSGNLTLSASDARIIGGNTTGRLLLANSGTSSYAIINGSAAATPNSFQFYADNSLALTIASTGAATFSNLAGTGDRMVQASSTGVLSATVAAPTSGTYTPTLTNGTNVTSNIFYSATYTRIGNVVTVYMNLSVTPTATGVAVLYVSLPVASNIAIPTDINGFGIEESNISTDQPLIVVGDGTNDRAQLNMSFGAATGAHFVFSFQYPIL